jgi:hypothetical protein
MLFSSLGTQNNPKGGRLNSRLGLGTGDAPPRLIKDWMRMYACMIKDYLNWPHALDMRQGKLEPGYSIHEKTITH